MPIKGHEGQISIFIKSSQIIDQNEALKLRFSVTLVSRPLKVTQGQKLPIKGHKGQISILIKSGQIIPEKEGLTMTFSMTLVSR